MSYKRLIARVTGFSLSLTAWGMMTPQQETRLLNAPWSKAKAELIAVLDRVSGDAPWSGYCQGRALLQWHWNNLAAKRAISKYFKGLKKQEQAPKGWGSFNTYTPQ